MEKGKLLVFGDSILKGVQVGDDRRYKISKVGFETIPGWTVNNVSRFGCTVTKALDSADQVIQRSGASVALMDFGGNDCDYDWRAVAANPNGTHSPRTELFDFRQAYMRLIDKERTAGIEPLLMTLPPIDSEKYLQWFCTQLHINRSRVMQWLGDVSRIDEQQARYSEEVEKIAKAMGTGLIDVRSCFKEAESSKSLLCVDGIHPNVNGQSIIMNSVERLLA